MPQLTFKPDENVTFPVMTTFNGTPADLPADGSFDVHSLYVLRDGQPINLNRAFGVTFSSVSGAGNYIATIDRTALVTEAGQPFVQQNGDVFNFAEIANINGGQVFGVNQQATIETDLGQAVSDIQQTLTAIAPVAPDIPLESSNVRQGVVFGKVGDEQVGTFSPVCDVAGSGNVVDAVLKPVFEAVLESSINPSLLEGDSCCTGIIKIVCGQHYPAGHFVWDLGRDISGQDVSLELQGIQIAGSTSGTTVTVPMTSVQTAQFTKTTHERSDVRVLIGSGDSVDVVVSKAEIL